MNIKNCEVMNRRMICQHEKVAALREENLYIWCWSCQLKGNTKQQTPPITSPDSTTAQKRTHPTQPHPSNPTPSPKRPKTTSLMRVAQALPLALHRRQDHLAIPAEQLGEGSAVLRQEVDQVAGIVLTVASATATENLLKSWCLQR